MKQLSFILLAFISFAFVWMTPETYSVETSKSSIIWYGRKVGGEHEGTINIKKGEVKLENGQVIGGSLVLDMPSIIVTDIESESSNKKLKDHLHASYFFDVANHPTGEFIISSVIHQEGNSYTLEGELTLKGIQKVIKVPATILDENNVIVIVGETDIDRNQFNLKYDSGSFLDAFGDKVIKDEFGVKFKVLARK